MPRNKIASGHLCRRVEEWPEVDQAAWREAVPTAPVKQAVRIIAEAAIFWVGV
jgi:hypothetical protein